MLTANHVLNCGLPVSKLETGKVYYSAALQPALACFDQSLISFVSGLKL